MITSTAFAIPANYHGISVNYFAMSLAHYGNAWLSFGHIGTSEVVDQIGSTFWSVLEYCGSTPNYSSYYSFNGAIYYRNDLHNRSFFRNLYNACGSQENKFRTYIQFYVQDSPYSGQEWLDTDWATW